MKSIINERQEFRNKDAGTKTIFSTSKRTDPKTNVDQLTRELFNLDEQLNDTSRIKRTNAEL